MAMDLQTFLAKARAKEEKKLLITEIEVKDFGMVEFVRPKDEEMMKYMTSVTNANKEDIKIMSDISKEFVYLCCPILQKTEIQREFDIKMPFETPIVLFGFMETMNLAGEIFTKFNGIEVVEEVEETIKN